MNTNTNAKTNTIIGIDPGLTITGWGIVGPPALPAQECDCVAFGAIKTPAKWDLGKRLRFIAETLEKEIQMWQPTAAAIEDIFVSLKRKNYQSAIKLAHARGVAIETCERLGLTCHTYNNTVIKKAVTGHMRAKKPDVAMMACSLLGIPVPDGPEDITDALAIAVCGYRRIVRVTPEVIEFIKERRNEEGLQ